MLFTKVYQPSCNSSCHKVSRLLHPAPCPATHTASRASPRRGQTIKFEPALIFTSAPRAPRARARADITRARARPQPTQSRSWPHSCRRALCSCQLLRTSLTPRDFAGPAVTVPLGVEFAGALPLARCAPRCPSWADTYAACAGQPHTNQLAELSALMRERVARALSPSWCSTSLRGHSYLRSWDMTFKPGTWHAIPVALTHACSISQPPLLT
jgi:hypothetical protein